MSAGRLAAIAFAAALAGCAAAPAPDDAATAAPTFTGELNGPGDLIGLSGDDVQAALGAPDVRRQDGDAQIWQYRAEGCVLDVFLYGAGTEARHAEARDLRGAIEDGPDCIDALRNRATLAS